MLSVRVGPRPLQAARRIFAATVPRPLLAQEQINRSMVSRSSDGDIPLRYHRSRNITTLTMKDGQKEKIRLTDAEELVLPMAFLKAKDASSPDPILGDAHSQQLLDRCEIDYGRSHFDPDQRNVEYIVGRAKLFDKWCQNFLEAHKAEPVTVLHIACGLDCRALRVKRGPNVRWIDVDQPLVVDLRSRLIPNVPGDYTLRTLQITKKGWLNDVPSDRPTLVIAEGLLMYLQQSEGEQVIRDVASYFGQGEFIFDTVGYLSVKGAPWAKHLKSSKSRWTWGVDNVEKEILPLHPKLKLRDQVFWWQFGRHPPMWGDFGTFVMSLHPKFKTNLSLNRFEF